MKVTLGAVLAFLGAVSLLSASTLHAQESALPNKCEEMARHIDKLIEERWEAEGYKPVKPASDAEFLRRVYLDFTGVIPTVYEARQFLSDKDPDKRAKLIDKLLNSPAYATHMATTWRNRMLPSNFDPAMLQSAAGLQNWLREQFVDNLRYDNVVADLLVATGAGNRGPGLFYTALELKPEKIAASTSRIFLGIQMQCAECHNHPHDRWTQKDFWGYAAFFARLEQPMTPNPLNPNTTIRDTGRGEVTLPDSDEVVPPRYPSGRMADESEGGERRVQLAIWMASRDNPFLPRAASNWAWAHMFGRGIVNPVDDLSQNNPPSHPQLLDDLALYFTRTEFDLKNLLRTLANTKVYQLSSFSEKEEAAPPELFTRMAVKSMTPDQLYDSLNRSLGRRPTNMGQARQQPFGAPIDFQRQQFLTRMATESQEVTEYEAGLPQALMLMNGPEMSQATNLQNSRLLGALEAKFFTNKQRLETLFLATLTRKPSEQESALFLEYIEKGGPTKDSKKALGDVLWALLNSAEFTLNH